MSPSSTTKLYRSWSFCQWSYLFLIIAKCNTRPKKTTRLTSRNINLNSRQRLMRRFIQTSEQHPNNFKTVSNQSERVPENHMISTAASLALWNVMSHQAQPGLLSFNHSTLSWHSDQVHQAAPGGGSFQQHQVLLLWRAEWARLHLQQGSRQRLKVWLTQPHIPCINEC